MSALSWKRTTGLAGIVHVVLFFALGLMILDGPSITDSAADTREWFEDNTTEVALFTWAMPFVAGVLFLVFASGLRSVLGPADEKNRGVWARVSFAGAVLQAAVGFVGLSFWGVLAQEDVLAAVSDDTMQTLNAFDTVLFFAIMNWAVALFVLGASVVIIQSGVMAKWIGWFGAVLALLSPIASLWLFSGDDGNFFGEVVGTVAFLGNLVWTLAVAITMVRSGAEDSEAAPVQV